ncbi:MAG: transposase [Chloroflexota bacterium]|nr:transposase [Chloroflexota bacterium]
MRKAFRFRLYPNRAQAERLASLLEACRRLYNAALQERRDAWHMQRKSISFASQCAQLPAIKEDCPEYTGIYAQVLQDVLHRADRAFAAFFLRVRRGEAPGHPRFKSRGRYDSFTFPQVGEHGIRLVIEGGRLSLPGVGRVKLKQHRSLDGELKTLSVKQGAGGHWYALFSCVVEARPLSPSNEAVGIDVGLESFLITSDGQFVDNPRLLRMTLNRLAAAQQRLSRRQRGSRRRQKARRLVARHHERVADTRRDFHHKLARSLVNRYGFLALEKLQVRNMVRNRHLSLAISDAGWGQFISILLAKAEEAGREVVLVNPRGTSQTCSACGAVSPKDLSERWHSCACGLSLHRDLNASRNILALGRSAQGVS